jgi:uncharacterized membrane protein
MFEGVLLGILFFFGYPFIAALLATRSVRRRLEALEASHRALETELKEVRGKAIFAATAAVARPEPAAAPPPAHAPPPAAGQASATPPPSAPQAVLPAQPPSAPEAPALFAELPRVAVAPPAVAAATVPAPAASAAVPPAIPAAIPAAAPSAVPPPIPRVVPAPPKPAETPAWLKAVKTWLFTGNLVAKVGILILFIGVSFLLKYASERVSVPIELRLAGIVVADIALLVWGWRIRLTHRGLSLPIQGGALAIMMLVTFGAFRIYHLIPSGLAFGLLFVLTIFTCLLAVLQNAFWLATFGIVGGFVSPILTSTGSGSHVALFSYYTLLNAGILAIALKRSWRALNLLGFAFTFLIGTAWGMRSYDPALHYLSTQLFLILFFGFYVTIAVVWAMRQSLQLKAYVDATLIFGTPLAAFGLQVSLMRNVEFGNAFSALGFGVFYTALALALWKRRSTSLKMLVESFLALGVVFGTLAIPFALDGRWTSAAWALEGAGVVWVALRQRQRLTMMFGLLVQAGAWISFIGAISGLDKQAAQQSNLWLGFLILAGTAFFMATSFRAQKDADGKEQEFPRAGTWFLGFAAVFFMAGAWTEIILRQNGTAMANMLVASGLATAVILGVIAARMQWVRAGTFALIAQLVSGATLLMLVALEWSWSVALVNPFGNALLGALMICGAALFTSFSMQRADPAMQTGPMARLMLVWSGFWWFGPILNTLSGSLMLLLLSDAASTSTSEAWSAMYLVCLAASALGFVMLARRLQWSQLRLFGASAWVALVPSTLAVLAILYFDQRLPAALTWIGFGAVWAASEVLLRLWPASGWQLTEQAQKGIHLVRTVGPWIMLWKAGEVLISRWMFGISGDYALLNDAGYRVSGSWANFVPAWAMMLVVVWLIRRSASQQWPVAPLAGWYRHQLLPAAAIWSLGLAALWNLFQDGSMAPLPYVPLLNPLDLTTAFALMLGAYCYRMLRADRALLPAAMAARVARLPLFGMVYTYVWFNLILLRSAAHYLDIDYTASALFGSLFIQAMLTLVWSLTAMVIMRHATTRASRKQWLVGAGFLGLVVAKLFLVDISGRGNMSTIVSFVGAGLLILLIAYLAPYPSEAAEPESVQPGA